MTQGLLNQILSPPPPPPPIFFFFRLDFLPHSLDKSRFERASSCQARCGVEDGRDGGWEVGGGGGVGRGVGGGGGEDVVEVGGGCRKYEGGMASSDERRQRHIQGLLL